MESPLQLSSVKYQKDAYITVEGKSNADRFFIIQQGKVAISKEVEVAKEENKILNPGDFFGVISTMSGHNHIETAQALTEVVMIAVQKDQYGALIQKNSLVAMKIITQFSRRLRFLNETLAGISMKKTAEAGPDHLFEVAEYYFSQKQYGKAIHIFNRYIVHSPDGKKVNTAKERIGSLKSQAIGSIKEVETKPNDLKRTYPKDYLLFVEGEPGDELFIIQKGSVKITKITSDNEVLLAVLKAGDIFGEMALLEGKPRAATAMAYDDCEVMVINKANFEQMIQTQPQLIARVTGLLADRIWLIYRQLANTLINDPVGRVYDSLFIQLEKNKVPLTEPKPYTFSFGQWELANMVGLPEKEAKPVLAAFLENKKIEIIEGKIHCTSVPEIVKMAEYYRKMDKIKKAQAKSQQERAQS
ncbi:MAG: Crp/Fnr family transcriptional regulator [Treponema sp.]|nr:Crp/Fnr family transcriptional regulator [Treponema sp.]